MRTVAMRTFASALVTTTLAVIATAALARLNRPLPAGYDLLPDDACQPTCVLAMQIGVTTADEAFVLLNSHPHIGDIEHIETLDGGDMLRWRWSGNSPADVWRYRAYADGSGVIRRISMNTPLPLSLIRRRYGEPDTIIMYGTCSFGTMVESYPGGIEVFYDTPSAEPQRYRLLLERRVRVNVSADVTDTTTYRAVNGYGNTQAPIAQTDAPSLIHRDCEG